MKEFYSVVEVARRYGMEADAVRRWIRVKRLTAVRCGKQYRISADALKEFETRNKTA